MGHRARQMAKAYRRPYVNWRMKEAERGLREVILHGEWTQGVGWTAKQQLILCTYCLEKRIKQLPKLNRSMAGRYDGRARANTSIPYYSKPAYWVKPIHPNEKLECHDCGWKIRGRA